MKYLMIFSLLIIGCDKDSKDYGSIDFSDEFPITDPVIPTGPIWYDEVNNIQLDLSNIVYDEPFCATAIMEGENCSVEITLTTAINQVAMNPNGCTIGSIESICQNFGGVGYYEFNDDKLNLVGIGSYGHVWEQPTTLYFIYGQ